MAGAPMFWNTVAWLVDGSSIELNLNAYRVRVLSTYPPLDDAAALLVTLTELVVDDAAAAVVEAR